MVINKKKEDFIKTYKNELFELNEGCWILNKTGKSCGHHSVFKLDNVYLPDKIYGWKYNQLPMYSPIIKEIKYMIDSCEVESFDKMLYKKDGKTPSQYSVLLKFEGTGFNNRFYVCYDYEFSKLKYPKQEKNDPYYSEKRKKDVEYKLFILESLEAKL